MKRRLIAILVLLALFAADSASAEVKTGEGGQAGEFLRYGVSVRSFGLGRSGLALIDDATAVYYNPAALLSSQRLTSAYIFSEYNGSTFPYYQADLSEGGFNFVSLSFNRPGLLGPTSALGLGAVISNDGGYEYRDADDQLLSNDRFAFAQWAFIVSGSHEWTPGRSWGIVDVGASLKIVRHEVSGVAALEHNATDWGLDLGADVRLMNIPRLRKIFGLRDLLAFRMAAVIQNLKAPKIGFGGSEDDYPTSFRLGASYDVGERLLWPKAQLVVASDVEFVSSRSADFFFGIEPGWSDGTTRFSLRSGLGSGAGEVRPALGCGLQTVLEGLKVRFDFAWGYHARLHDDTRIAVTLGLGPTRDAGYYSDEALGGLSELDRKLLTLTDWPRNRRTVASAAKWLATADPDNKERYWELYHGVSEADRVFEAAWTDFQMRALDPAREKAEAAIEKYDSALVQGQMLSTDSRTNLAACHMIVSDFDEALSNLDSTGTDLRANYLKAVCLDSLSRWTEAAAAYRRAARLPGADDASMKLLSHLGWGRALMEQGIRDSARFVWQVITADYDAPLDADYPRFSHFADGNVVDDAQYWIGESFDRDGRRDDAMRAWAEICRFWPDSDWCRDVELQQQLEGMIRGEW